MKAILIDPANKSITEVEYDGHYGSIYKLIDADRFDVVYIGSGKNSDSFYVDDEGLFKPDQSFFWAKGWSQPLAGKGLLLGVDDAGDSISPKTTVASLKRNLRFLDANMVGLLTSAGYFQ